MKALDLFAGAGGWDIAAESLGIEVDGVENMPEANRTRDAAGLKTALWDVRDVIDILNLGQYDALIASPPCQSFSTAGKGKGRDEMTRILNAAYAFGTTRPPTFDEVAITIGSASAALVLEPLRVALAMRPEWIAFEQVPTVLPIWEACAEVLRWRGYHVVTGNVQAEQYGVPQTRKRALLLASLDGPVALPTPTHSRYYNRDPKRLDDGVLPWVSMAEALGWNNDDLVGFPRRADAGNDTVNLDGVDYRARDLFPANGPSPVLTGKSRSWQRWLRNNNTAHAAVRPVESPAPTVHFGARMNAVTWEGGRTATSGSVRVSVEEASVLQTFPADFPWQGVRTKQYLQVGNAIPPLLASAVLRAASGITQAHGEVAV